MSSFRDKGGEMMSYAGVGTGIGFFTFALVIYVLLVIILRAGVFWGAY